MASTSGPSANQRSEAVSIDAAYEASRRYLEEGAP